jgi:hypothetical protein
VQDARIYCQEIRDTIKILKSNRDMAFNEIKLTVAIEDPRARERRENLGIEVGVSSHLCGWTIVLKRHEAGSRLHQTTGSAMAWALERHGVNVPFFAHCRMRAAFHGTSWRRRCRRWPRAASPRTASRCGSWRAR